MEPGASGSTLLAWMELSCLLSPRRSLPSVLLPLSTRVNTSDSPKLGRQGLHARPSPEAGTVTAVFAGVASYRLPCSAFSRDRESARHGLAAAWPMAPSEPSNRPQRQIQKDL